MDIEIKGLEQVKAKLDEAHSALLALEAKVGQIRGDIEALEDKRRQIIAAMR